MAIVHSYPQLRSAGRPSRNFGTYKLFAITFAAGLIGGVLLKGGMSLGDFRELASPAQWLGLGRAIKGDISAETGERIYHMPGHATYAQAEISKIYGERWFCSEAQARASGWQPPKIQQF